MGGLVQVLCIKRCTQTQSYTGTEFDIVRESSDSAVVDLGLIWVNNALSGDGSRPTLANELGSSLYLVATSSPTLLEALESQVAFAPASTSLFTW